MKTTKTKTEVKRGRKPQFNEPGKRDTAYLPQSSWETLVLIGENNFSRGVRIALEAYQQQYGNIPNPELLAEVI